MTFGPGDPVPASGPDPGPRATPSRTLRLVGLFCLVAGVLALVGAITGWDANGTPRAALWVAGIVLLVLSLPCLVTRGPRVIGAGADPAGISVELRNGAREQIPWSDVAAVRLTGVGPPPHTSGWVLDLHADRATLAEHKRVGRWAQPRGGGAGHAGAGHLIVPVPSSVGYTLDAQLRTFAGVRYRPGT